MERIPHPSHPLIQTPYHPAPLNPLHLLPIRIPQQLHLLQNLLFLQIPHAYDLFPSIDVRTPNYRMRIWSWRDMDDDLRVGFCERGNEGRAEEGAARKIVC